MDSRTLERTDPGFVDDLITSQESVELVADWLRRGGFRGVEVSPLRIRPDASARTEYADGGDIHYLERLEVKRRDLAFTGAHDYPYRDGVFVDVCHTFDHASPKPIAYVILNARATHAAVVKRDTAGQWRRVRKLDAKRGRVREFYVAPLSVVNFIRFEVGG